MSKIISIGTANPTYGTDQSTIEEFMQKAYQNETASRKLKLLFHHSGIKTRYSVVPDFTNGQSEEAFFLIDQPLPNVVKRLDVYKKQALSLAVDAIQHSLKKLNTTILEFEPTHLITVSCTGIYAPGLDTEIINQLNLPDDIFHTSINFMGCNAAFPALKIADMMAKTDENARVIIVCVELCTLHFQPKDDSDNLLSNTIFGDGAAAVLVVSDAAAKKHHQKGMVMNGFYSLLLPKGKELMAWNINPINFEMVLDSKVPDFIGQEAKDIVLRSGKKLHFSLSEIDKWAVHPGGKKDTGHIKKAIELN